MKNKLNSIILIGWLLGASIPIGYLMGYHMTSIEQERLRNPTSLTSDQSKSWKMIHVIGESCKCSITLSEYLIERKPLVSKAQFVEEVIIIGNNPSMQKKLEEVGFKVRLESEQNMVDQFNIDGVPQLVILNPENQLKYSGGYTQERITASTQNDQYHDLEIFHQTKNGNDTSQMPIFGCANGIKNKLKADPLGLKY